MMPHPQTMQKVTDQRWHESQVGVPRERPGRNTQLAAGTWGIFRCPTPGRVTAADRTAWLRALASVTFVLRALPRASR